jgi:hypothetical protein
MPYRTNMRTKVCLGPEELRAALCSYIDSEATEKYNLLSKSADVEIHIHGIVCNNVAPAVDLSDVEVSLTWGKAE